MKAAQNKRMVSFHPEAQIHTVHTGHVFILKHTGTEMHAKNGSEDRIFGVPAAHYKSPHNHPDVLKSELYIAKIWRYVSRIK